MAAHGRRSRPAITATSFADSGLDFSTIYYYRVMAVSSAGDFGRERGGQRRDAGAARQSWRPGRDLDHGEGKSFTGPVATFTDANARDHGGTLHRDHQLGRRTFEPRHGQRERRSFHGQRHAYVYGTGRLCRPGDCDR